MTRPVSRSLVPALGLAVLVAQAPAVTLLADTFDTKATGSNINGRAVETSTLPASSWQTGGSAATTWTVDGTRGESGAKSLRATTTDSAFSRAAPIFLLGAVPPSTSYVAATSIYFAGGGTMSPGASLVSRAGESLGFVTFTPAGGILAIYGDGNASGGLGSARFANGAAASYLTGAWNRIEQHVDVTATTQTTTYYVNGQQLYIDGAPMTLTYATGSVAGLQAFQLSFQPLTSATGSGTAFYDNVALTTPVPEPATLAALGLGALGILRRRKRA